MNLKWAINAAPPEAAQDRHAARSRKARRKGLKAHPIFAPMLALWGAGCGGICVMVLPDENIAAMTAMIAPQVDPAMARLIMAGLAALLLGLACFGIGRALGRRARLARSSSSLAAMALRQVRPIDPANELGSASLDAPLDNKAGFAFPADAADDDGSEENAGKTAHSEPQGLPFNLKSRAREWDAVDSFCKAEDDAGAAPVELNLSEFAILPGRNGVWVEEPAAPASHPAAQGQSAPGAASAAIARLRAVPPGELSLVQMVERFAVALRDYQTAKTAEAAARADDMEDHDSTAERDAVLGEALRALAQVTERGHAEAAWDESAWSKPANRAMHGAA